MIGNDTWNSEFLGETDIHKNVLFGQDTNFSYCEAPFGFKRGFREQVT